MICTKCRLREVPPIDAAALRKLAAEIRKGWRSLGAVHALLMITAAYADGICVFCADLGTSTDGPW